MTREEEIEKAKPAFSFDHNPYDTQIAREWFGTGAEWADSHPRNPWKSMNEELPKETLFLRDRWGDVFVANYYYSGIDWWDVRGDSHREDEIRDQYAHWMPIPELPKEN